MYSEEELVYEIKYSIVGNYFNYESSKHLPQTLKRYQGYPSSFGINWIPHIFSERTVIAFEDWTERKFSGIEEQERVFKLSYTPSKDLPSFVLSEYAGRLEPQERARYVHLFEELACFQRVQDFETPFEWFLFITKYHFENTYYYAESTQAKYKALRTYDQKLWTDHKIKQTEYKEIEARDKNPLRFVSGYSEIYLRKALHTLEQIRFEIDVQIDKLVATGFVQEGYPTSSSSSSDDSVQVVEPPPKKVKTEVIVIEDRESLVESLEEAEDFEDTTTGDEVTVEGFESEYKEGDSD
jgi:hypothetical protein